MIKTATTCTVLLTRTKKKLLLTSTFILLPTVANSFQSFTSRRSVHSLKTTQIKMSSALTAVDKGGHFKRKDSKHRNIIEAGSESFPPEADRYHVYIALGKNLHL